MNEIYINMPAGEHYGWGICGKNLIKELSNKVKVNYIDTGYEQQIRDSETQKMVANLKHGITSDVDAPFIHTINPSFSSECKFRGSPNIGYIFFESPENITDEMIGTMKSTFDIVVAGSEWNAQILRDKGVDAISIPQGVDRAIFHTGDNPPDDKFVIFSGGKWEHRKGQDIVVRAVAEAQKTYPDIHLVSSWYNVFSENGYFGDIRRLVEETGLKNLDMLPLMSQPELARAMQKTHIGIFPNRVEGGTNLVLMEYLACGKPVIANTSTGQSDVLANDYKYSVNEEVSQSVAAIALAKHTILLKEMGEDADVAMNRFTWEKMADRFLELI